jgi:hypothetical protein
MGAVGEPRAARAACARALGMRDSRGIRIPGVQSRRESFKRTEQA